MFESSDHPPKSESEPKGAIAPSYATHSATALPQQMRSYLRETRVPAFETYDVRRCIWHISIFMALEFQNHDERLATGMIAKHTRNLAIVVIAITLVGTGAIARAEVVRTLKKTGQTMEKPLSKTGHDAKDTLSDTGHDAKDTLGKTGNDAKNTLHKAGKVPYKALKKFFTGK